MIALTAAEIAEITNGRLDADPGITPHSVVTDSRDAMPGALYVAKPGEHADGHDFVAAAFGQGAVLVLAEHPVTGPDGVNYPAVLVQDAVLAMGALAAEAVRRIRAARASAGETLTVIGITGSAGKTTTKDLLAGILTTQGNTVAPQGSYNGEVGVPLTVFRADTGTRYLVIEMGATGIGHIRYLADMVKPDIGVVAGMRPRTVAAVLGFSAENRPEAAVRAVDPDTNAFGNPEFGLVLPGSETGLHVSSGLIGAHHTGNLLAAAAAAHAAGVTGEDIAASLSTQSAASRWRMERTERADGVTVINDAYNANPESMRAALRTLADLGRGRRTWAVLGAMLELGPDSIREHTAVGTQVVRLNISRLVVVGREARALYVSAVQEGSWGDECVFAETVEDAHSLLDAELEPGDLVLFKSSNSVGLRHLGDRIALPPQTTEPAEERSELQ
jgi:UDP-N-acetylmuramoyl-tripeptide--D-alanyl-D-alanine ligase